MARETESVPEAEDSGDAGSEVQSRGPDGEQAERILREFSGPVFGLKFFAELLSGRLRASCAAADGEVPQMLLHLGDGVALDVCHITEFAPRWMALMVFRGDRACAAMDVEIVPYGLITRVTLSGLPSEERRIGFDVKQSMAALSGDSNSSPERATGD